MWGSMSPVGSKVGRQIPPLERDPQSWNQRQELLQGPQALPLVKQVSCAKN